MITYNQEAYISEAIEGVLKQSCDYPVEVIIGEDCSTDNTREICRQYAAVHKNIRLLESNENLGMANNFIRTLKAASGRYIALCEGDDYWTDPDKLMKQVVFLENNQSYGLVCTDYDTLNTATGKTEKSFIRTRYGITEAKELTLQNYILNRFYIRTLTVVFRTEYLIDYLLQTESHIVMKQAAGDLPLWLFMLMYTNIKFIPDSTAVYRITCGTASRPVDPVSRHRFQKSIMDVIEYYIEKAGLPRRYRRKVELQKKIYYMEFLSRTGDLRKVLSQFTSILVHHGIVPKVFNILWVSLSGRKLPWTSEMQNAGKLR
jgi:glycosyltransferase involved in cell wall biosynthesis